MSRSYLKEFIFVEQCSLDGLVSWNKKIAFLEGLPEKRRSVFCRIHLPKASEHPDAGIRYAVKRAIEEDGQQLSMAMLGAVVNGTVRCYVLSGCGKHAFEVDPTVWRGEVADVLSPVTMAQTGRFSLNSCLRPRAAVDGGLAGNSLLLSHDDFSKLPGLLGSPADLRAYAREVVAQFERTNPDRPMLKELFRVEMRAWFPNAANSTLDRVRLDVKPEWRTNKGGRPRKH
jgi:hypothetical protein